MNNTIRLIDNKSTWHQLIEYPDGQKTIKLVQTDAVKFSNKYQIDIKCSIRNFEELGVLMALIKGLRREDFYIESLTFYYLFALRSDRSFNYGEPNYVRDILAPIINTFYIPNISIFAPHNQIVCEYLNADPETILIPTLPTNGFYLWGDQSAKFLMNSVYFSGERTQLILGAFDKIRNKEGISIGLSDAILNRLYCADKDYPIIIIDDLCDGGATFIVEAEYLRNVMNVKNPLYLFVAHGLFTKGLEPLLKHFDKIYCTNSYQTITHPKVVQYEII